jgi:hypothetical protein
MQIAIIGLNRVNFAAVEKTVWRSTDVDFVVDILSGASGRENESGE